MKRRLLHIFSIAYLLASLVALPARADLPTEMSWIEHSANPVSPAGLWGADGITWAKDAGSFLSPATSTCDNDLSTDNAVAWLAGETWQAIHTGANITGGQSGLVTLIDQAQLSFNPIRANVLVDADVVVSIVISSVADLYGYQFVVGYDATVVSATAEFDKSFFDTTTNAFIVWNATCSEIGATGTCKFAVTKMNPASEISGAGTLAKITFHSIKANSVTLTFSNAVLADRHGGTIAVSQTVGYIEVSEAFIISTYLYVPLVVAKNYDTYLYVPLFINEGAMPMNTAGATPDGSSLVNRLANSMGINTHLWQTARLLTILGESLRWLPAPVLVLLRTLGLAAVEP